MDDEDTPPSIPRIGMLPPAAPPIVIDRFTMREALTMPAWMVQDVLDELAPDIDAAIEYRRMLHDVKKIRLDIEAAGERRDNT